MRIRDTGGPVFRLKVSLRGVRPPIWRRFLVPSGITLKRLHDSLQVVMGWTDSHLHQFEAGGILYGASDRDSGVARVSEARTTLGQVLRRPKDRLRYEGWIAALEEDPREIRRAAADAQKISDFVLARSRDRQAEREPATATRAPAREPALRPELPLPVPNRSSGPSR